MLHDGHEAHLVIDDLTPESSWSNELTDEDHQWLKSIAELKPEQFLLSEQHQGSPTRSEVDSDPILFRDIHGWRAGRYIGDIHHQGRTLRIRPRLGIDTIAEWLSTIHNVQIVSETAGNSDANESLIIQLAAALWRAAVLDAGRHTLAREKATRHITGLRVRGKLDVRTTSRLRATGRHDLASTSTYRTLDTATNAAIVAADRVIDARIGNPRWRGVRAEEQLGTLRQAVGDNPRLPSKSDLRRARYSPIELKWKNAAKLSHLIASNRLLNRDTKTSSTFGLLIDVAELWERFVLHCLTEATSQSVTHGTNTLDHHLLHSHTDPDRGLGRLYPDMLVNPTDSPTTCSAVIDAKYKPLVDPRGVDREDLYQIHAYSLSFKPAQALLAYPYIPAPTSRAEKFSPWISHSGSEFDFLQLPTRQIDCIKTLKQWLSS